MKNKDNIISIVEDVDSPENRYRLITLIRMAQVISTILVAVGTIFLFLAILGLL